MALARKYRPYTPPAVEATEYDKYYAAGITDGEGSLSIKKHRHGTPRVYVGMCDADIVQWLLRTFGGWTYAYPNGRKRTKHEWILTGRYAMEFAEMIRPYLKMKHRQATLLTEWPRKLPPDDVGRAAVWRERDRIREALALLNYTPENLAGTVPLGQAAARAA